MPDRVNEANAVFFVGEHERRLNEHDGDIENIGNRLNATATKEDVRLLSDKVDKLNERLLVFALSVAGSAVIFALTTLAATGRLG